VRNKNTNNLLARYAWIATCIACFWHGCVSAAHPADNSTITLSPDVLLAPSQSSEPISPIQPVNSILDQRKIELGEKLFHEERLDSKQRSTSCSTCHNLRVGGTDQLAFSVNSVGKATQFNTPTIFNVSLNSQYYWSGKFHTLDDQVDDALKEINTTWPDLLRTLNSIPAYVRAFNSLYKDGITRNNVKDALVTYENSLTTPDSPFDRFLKGESDAITPTALQGYKLFKSFGCITCHQGKNIGGNVVINLDRLGAPFGKLHSTRHRLNGKLQHIRVPSLRNVAVTAPYFHDGSATTLYQAVQRMIDEYAGLDVIDTDVYKIVSFLRSLTGYYRGESL